MLEYVDNQYINALNADIPIPTKHQKKPSEEQIEAYRNKFNLESKCNNEGVYVCSGSLGFYMFLHHCKETPERILSEFVLDVALFQYQVKVSLEHHAKTIKEHYFQEDSKGNPFYEELNKLKKQLRNKRYYDNTSNKKKNKHKVSPWNDTMKVDFKSRPPDVFRHIKYLSYLPKYGGIAMNYHNNTILFNESVSTVKEFSCSEIGSNKNHGAIGLEQQQPTDYISLQWDAHMYDVHAPPTEQLRKNSTLSFINTGSMHARQVSHHNSNNHINTNTATNITSVSNTSSKNNTNDTGITSTTAPTPIKLQMFAPSTYPPLSTYPSGQFKPHILRFKPESVILKNLLSDYEQGVYAPNMFDAVEEIVFRHLIHKQYENFKNSILFTKYMEYLTIIDMPMTVNDYTVFRVLGRGGFGLVSSCKSVYTGKIYVMKVMNKKRIKFKRAEKLCINEWELMQIVDSPFIVGLKYSFTTPDDIYFIIDLMVGGDLAFLLHKLKRFDLQLTRYYAARIIMGLKILHDANIVYRDLKPENILMDESGRTKLSDLGLACFVGHGGMSGASGTRGYWAPDVLRRNVAGQRVKYNIAVDYFSLGVVLYEFLSGINPFKSIPLMEFPATPLMVTRDRGVSFHMTVTPNGAVINGGTAGGSAKELGSNKDIMYYTPLPKPSGMLAALGGGDNRDVFVSMSGLSRKGLFPATAATPTNAAALPQEVAPSPATSNKNKKSTFFGLNTATTTPASAVPAAVTAGAGGVEPSPSGFVFDFSPATNSAMNIPLEQPIKNTLEKQSSKKGAVMRLSLCEEQDEREGFTPVGLGNANTNNIEIKSAMKSSFKSASITPYVPPPTTAPSATPVTNNNTNQQQAVASYPNSANHTASAGRQSTAVTKTAPANPPVVDVTCGLENFFTIEKNNASSPASNGNASPGIGAAAVGQSNNNNNNNGSQAPRSAKSISVAKSVSANARRYRRGEELDIATLYLEPDYPDDIFDPITKDFIQKLLKKHPKDRLGTGPTGIHEIMDHPFFQGIEFDRLNALEPPYKPTLTDINAMDQKSIGDFNNIKEIEKVVLTETDQEVYKDCYYINKNAYESEVVEFLMYEDTIGPILPQEKAACCVIS